MLLYIIKLKMRLNLLILIANFAGIFEIIRANQIVIPLELSIRDEYERNQHLENDQFYNDNEFV